MAEQAGALTEAAYAAVTSPARVRVLLLCERAPQSSRSVSAELGMKVPAALHHLAALERAGLVHEVGRVAISGGPLISYGTVRPGWGRALDALNRLAAESISE